MEKDEIPFNAWSQARIIEGKKICTSRHKRYDKDDRVYCILPKLPWGIIRKYFWKEEGASSPEELQQVIESIYKRKVPDDEMFFVHFFQRWGVLALCDCKCHSKKGQCMYNAEYTIHYCKQCVPDQFYGDKRLKGRK